MSNLYTHQADGAGWLATRARAYLGDQPGLGKTRTLLRALMNVGSKRALVVCPAIVRTHWRREYQELLGDNPLTAIDVRSYDEITRGGVELMKHFIADNEIDALILDEAHYLKHANSARTKTLLGLNGYARRVRTVYAASGTPVPKHPAELWTILSSMFPEVCVEHKVRSFRAFVGRFCATRLRMMRGKMTEKFLPEVRNEAEFKEILGKIMLARTLDDVGIDVPPLDWQTLRLDSGQPAAMDAWHNIATAIEGCTLEDISADPEVARMRRRLGELKIAPVAEMLASQLADSEEKVVVFAHHRTVMSGLRELLKNYGVCYIDGDTVPFRRDIEIDRFQNDPKARVFLGQNIACQTGITLTAARRVVLVEPDWTAVVNQQLGHRVARIGQQAARCIGQMVALAGTLDEAIINQNLREVRMAETLGLGDG
jgi:SWI/SNF-related matrix-associated actin-dependent regulator 1 of chromatin subfamily A